MPQDDRLYSDEAQEVLSKILSWIIRWGVSVIFIIFAGIIIGSYFIKFPQVLTAPITITTTNPPSDLIAKLNGRIDSILCEEGDIVAVGDVIAYLSTTADYNDIIYIEEELESLNDTIVSFLQKKYRMVEMQTSFSEFRNYCIDLLLEQIAKYGIYLNQQRAQRDILAVDLEIQYRSVRKDSLLLSHDAII